MNVARTKCGQEVNDDLFLIPRYSWKIHELASIFKKSDKGLYEELYDRTDCTPEKTSWTMQELAREFPKNIGRCKELRKEIINQIFYLQSQPRAYLRSEEGTRMLNEAYIDNPIRELIEKIKKIDTYLYLCQKKTRNEEVSIGRAKSSPMANWVEIHNGFASCFLHNDKTPSMKYYEEENKVHCFSCGFHGDVIDVVQKIKGCSFIDAVKYCA